MCLINNVLMMCYTDMSSAPLDPNPTTDLDKIVHELRLQYRTICCEFHVNEVVIWLFCVFLLYINYLN